MIKSIKGKVHIKGNKSELLADLTGIIKIFMQNKDIDEELIDIAIGLGKADAKGNKSEFLEETLKNLFKKRKTMAINLSELMKQAQEENEG